MWLQRYTDYLLRHRWQAMALTFGVTFIPVVGVLGILFAALVTLVKGLAEGALVTLAASLPFILSFLITETRGEETSLLVWAAVGVAIISNVLTWVFAAMLRKKSTWSMVLQVAALVGVLMVSVIHLAYPNVADWWGEQLRTYYHRAATTVVDALDNKTTATATTAAKAITAKVGQTAPVSSATVTTGPEERPNTKPTEQNAAQLESVNITKQYASGMIIAVVLFNAIMQLIVARWWQGLVFHTGRLRKELHAVRLSQLAGVLFLMAMVFWYLGNSVVVDMVPIVFMLFGGAGLSLVHYLFGLIQSSTAWFWLVLVYVTLVFALPESVFLLALVALCDVWFDLRKKMHKI